MKIEKVSFDNLNSLGGHFELDFTHPSLAEAGIFVITGPTGSGKTTLLDAITYALYGQTARQGRITATSNEVMTQGARFCRAEVVVEKDGTRYLFSTEQRRKKTRSSATPACTTAERRVSRLAADGSLILLHSDVNGVRQLADGLMKYENFCRCMMLAQGEFARFLRADARERSETLATITGTEIYQCIGEKVQARVATLRATLEAVTLLPVMDAAARAAAEERSVQQEQHCKTWQAKMESLNRALAWHAALERANATLGARRAEHEQAQAALQQFCESGKPARIRAAEAAQAIRPQEVAARAAEAERATTQARLEAEEAWLAANPGHELREAAQQAAAELAERQPQLEKQLHFIMETLLPLEEALGKAELRARAAAQQEATRRHEAEEAATTAHTAGQQARQATADEQAAAASLAVLPPLGEATRAHEAAQQRAALAYKIRNVSDKLEELYREFCKGNLPCCPCCGAPTPHRHPKQEEGELAEAQQETQRLAAELDSLRSAHQQARERQAAASSARNAAELAAQRAAAELQKKTELHQQAVTAAREATQVQQELQAQLDTLRPGDSARKAEQNLRATLAGLQSRCTHSQEAWQRFLTLRESHAALARAAAEQLPLLREQAQQARTLLVAALQEHGFADEQACAASLLPASELNALRQQETTLRQALAAAEGALRLASVQETELRAQRLSHEPATALEEQKDRLAEVLEEQSELSKTLLAELLRDDAARQANAQKEAQLADTRRELSQWQRLYEILGNTRDGFKKYAQRITFNLLLRQANHRLRQLTDRYTLMQDEGSELGLRVRDRYQDDDKGRSCSNLSGGESFMVSLALALGLSNMAGETRIDSLFLDEGFGTLDEDALEQVLHCLQSLRAGGKLIGIISHVETLRERIPANIELQLRGTRGLSTIAPHEAVVAEPC